MGCTMVKRQTKTYTDEFKIAAVKRIQQGESLNSVSKKIGVATSTLTPWVEKFKNAARVSAVVDSVVVVPDKKTTKKKRAYKLFSIEEKTSAIRMAMEGTSHDKICKHLGMSRPSLTNWIKEHKASIGSQERNAPNKFKSTIDEFSRHASQQAVKQNVQVLNIGDIRQKLDNVTKQRDFYKKQMEYCMKMVFEAIDS